MILCGCTTELHGRVYRVGYRHPPLICKSGGGWIRAEQVNESRVAYKKINDGA